MEETLLVPAFLPIGRLIPSDPQLSSLHLTFILHVYIYTYVQIKGNEPYLWLFHVISINVIMVWYKRVNISSWSFIMHFVCLKKGNIYNFGVRIVWYVYFLFKKKLGRQK